MRKWLAGYAFDPERQLMRIYLSTLKPKPPKIEGGCLRLLKCMLLCAGCAKWLASDPCESVLSRRHKLARAAARLIRMGHLEACR